MPFGVVFILLVLGLMGLFMPVWLRLGWGLRLRERGRLPQKEATATAAGWKIFDWKRS